MKIAIRCEYIRLCHYGSYLGLEIFRNKRNKALKFHEKNSSNNSALPLSVDLQQALGLKASK